jgi:hypothetical protein
MHKNSHGLEGYVHAARASRDASLTQCFFFDSRMRTVSKKVIMYALGQSSVVIDGRMIDSHDTETGILTWYMHIHICA